MKPIYVDCVACAGHGHIVAPKTWAMCKPCDGFGRVWAPDAPSFGCTMDLAEREPGEVVELGSGERARIMWHQPKKARHVVPRVTFLALIDDFDGYESDVPRPYPSCIGVASVRVPIPGGADDHAGEKGGDAVDPVLRGARANRGGLL